MKDLMVELEETLAGDLSFAGMQVQAHLLDALACQFHNEGWALDGNTEENDHRWLAQRMWASFTQAPAGSFDDLEAAEQERWCQMARAAISALPDLMGRIALRAVRWSKALRMLERAVRAESRREPRGLREIGDQYEPCWCGHVRALHGLSCCAGADRLSKVPCPCRQFRSMDTQDSGGKPAKLPKAVAKDGSGQ